MTSGEKTAYEHEKKERKIFKLRIIYNKKGCVSSGHCVLSDPFNFELDNEFRAVLKNGKLMPGMDDVWFADIETDSPHLPINAAKTCTPRVIGIIDLETGKRIAP